MTPTEAQELNARAARECMGWKEGRAYQGLWLRENEEGWLIPSGYARDAANATAVFPYWDPLTSPACRDALKERLADLGWNIHEMCHPGEWRDAPYGVRLYTALRDMEFYASAPGEALVRAALQAVTPAPAER